MLWKTLRFTNSPARNWTQESKFNKIENCDDRRMQDDDSQCFQYNLLSTQPCEESALAGTGKSGFVATGSSTQWDPKVHQCNNGKRIYIQKRLWPWLWQCMIHTSLISTNLWPVGGGQPYRDSVWRNTKCHCAEEGKSDDVSLKKDLSWVGIDFYTSLHWWSHS